MLDQLWYLTAVSALCPFVAVLGARRGRLLEWSLFVVLPLIVVLEWPALAQLTRCWHGQRLELELPPLIAFGLVLFMGVGNFAGGTRFGLAACCWIVMWCWIVGRFKGLNSITLDRDWVPALVAAGQLLFWWCATRSVRRRSLATGWDRVWYDFRDFFGNVWATRTMTRINEVAEREKWSWRLTPNGLCPTSHDPSPPDSPIDNPRVDHTFRWLLKPFVDPEWIDERLTASTDRASDG